MPMTALVTAQHADLGAQHRPDWEPLVRIALDRPSVTHDGVAVTTEPVEMDDDGDGNLTADLIVTEEFVRPARYVPTVDWLSPSGAVALRETLPVIVVPPEGGTLAELSLVDTSWGLAWQGSTPPAQSMLWLYIDPDYDPESGDPLPVYTAASGEVIEHGELVEWNAGSSGALVRLGHLRGPQGVKGEQGPAGVDGDPNAVADFDEALGTVLSRDGSPGNMAVRGEIDGYAPGVIAQQIGTAGSDVQDAVGDRVAAVGDQRYPLREDDELIPSSWTFGKGLTEPGEQASVGVERDFSTANGDIGEAHTRLEMRVGEQAATTQNPPFYSMGEIRLLDEGHPDPAYNGEIATMKIYGGRFLFSDRVEVNMGGRGRATLRSGTNSDEEMLRLQLHSTTEPHFSIYGPNDVNAQNQFEFRGGMVEMNFPTTASTVHTWNRTDGNGQRQMLSLSMFDAGHWALRGHVNGGATTFGAIIWNPSDRSLSINSTGGIFMGPGVEFGASEGPIMTASDGSRWRLGVTTEGGPIFTRL